MITVLSLILAKEYKLKSRLRPSSRRYGLLRRFRKGGQCRPVQRHVLLMTSPPAQGSFNHPRSDRHFKLYGTLLNVAYGHLTKSVIKHLQVWVNYQALDFHIFKLLFFSGAREVGVRFHVTAFLFLARIHTKKGECMCQQMYFGSLRIQRIT